MKNYEINAPPERQEVIITQSFEAPREVVFRTICDPHLISEWWGPENVKTRVDQMEVKPGGLWRYVQKDDENKEFRFHGVFHEISAPERLVFTSEFEGMPGHVSLYIETFEEHDGNTVVTLRVLFETVEDRDQMMQWGMEEGTRSMTNRLIELVSHQANESRAEVHMDQQEERTGCITVTRIFEASPERIWQEWTEPIQFKCWWGPKDFDSPYANLDVRKGGKFLVSMRGPDGKQYWDTGKYEEIDVDKHLVYTDSFADENGNVVPASYYGMGPDRPLEMAVEVTLEELGNQTRLILEQCGLPEGDMLENARTGWNQSLDKLAQCLR